MIKIILTLKELRKTAYHHYGNNPLSLLKFIYYSLFRVNHFLIFISDSESPSPEIEFEPGYRVILPTIETMDLIREGRDLPREFYYDIIHKVKNCFLVLYGDEIAYIHWVYYKGNYSRFLKIGNASAEINYMVTMPKYRGRHLAGKMLSYTVKYLRQKGYNKIFVICHEQNPPAIKSFKYAGFREWDKIKAIGPFNMKISV